MHPPPDDPIPRPSPADVARRRRALVRRIDHAIGARRRAVERLDALACELAELDRVVTR